jgi:hypothetical protein
VSGVTGLVRRVTSESVQTEVSVGRNEMEFLAGFAMAALLMQRLQAQPPSFTTRQEYAESVAHLHGDSDDLLSRGLAVGCLSALGK